MIQKILELTHLFPFIIPYLLTCDKVNFYKEIKAIDITKLKYRKLQSIYKISFSFFQEKQFVVILT